MNLTPQNCTQTMAKAVNCMHSLWLIFFKKIEEMKTTEAGSWGCDSVCWSLRLPGRKPWAQFLETRLVWWFGPVLPALRRVEVQGYCPRQLSEASVKLCSQKKLREERAYSVYRLQFEGGKLGLHFKAGTWDRDRAEAMLTPLGPWLTQFALLIQPMPTYPGMAPPIVGCSLLYQLTIRKMHSHAFAILMEAMPQLRVPFPGMSSWQDYLSWLYREPGSARKNRGYKWTLLKRENQRNK